MPRWVVLQHWRHRLLGHLVCCFWQGPRLAPVSSEQWKQLDPSRAASASRKALRKQVAAAVAWAAVKAAPAAELAATSGAAQHRSQRDLQSGVNLQSSAQACSSGLS